MIKMKAVSTKHVYALATVFRALYGKNDSLYLHFLDMHYSN